MSTVLSPAIPGELTKAPMPLDASPTSVTVNFPIRPSMDEFQLEKNCSATEQPAQELDDEHDDAADDDDDESTVDSSDDEEEDEEEEDEFTLVDLTPEELQGEVATALESAAAGSFDALADVSFKVGAPVLIAQTPVLQLLVSACSHAARRKHAVQTLSNLAGAAELRPTLISAGAAAALARILAEPAPAATAAARAAAALRQLAAGALLLLTCGTPETAAALCAAGAPKALLAAAEANHGADGDPRTYHLIKTALHRLGSRLPDAGFRDLSSY